MLSSLVVLGAAALHLLNASEDDARGSWLPDGFRLPNIVHPFMPALGKRTLPVPVAPFDGHVRGVCSETLPEKAIGIRLDEQGRLEALTERARIPGSEMAVNASVQVGESVYHATDAGLYVQETSGPPSNSTPLVYKTAKRLKEFRHAVNLIEHHETIFILAQKKAGSLNLSRSALSSMSR